MDALKLIAQDSLKADVSEAIKVGNTIKIWVKIREGERERLQAFEGTVIAIKGSGVSQTFTVRRVSYGVGVERPRSARCSAFQTGAPPHRLRWIPAWAFLLP